MQTTRLIHVPFSDLCVVMAACVQYHWAVAPNGSIHNVPQPGVRVPENEREGPCILAANEIIMERGGTVSCGSLREAAGLLKIRYESAFFITMHARFSSGSHMRNSSGAQVLWARFYNPELRKILTGLCD